jgi:hypothetical protein
MTAYLSDHLITPGAKPSPGVMGAGVVSAIVATVAVPATFTTTDVAQMCFLPAGFRVLDMTLKSDDLDSATTITLNVGDAGSATRYFSASTVAQSGTAGHETLAGGIGYLNTARTRVDIVPNAGPATTAGNITLIVLGIFEGSAA